MTLDAQVGERAIHDSENTICALAPHGGAIEPGTDDQAAQLAASIDRCSLWSFAPSLSTQSTFDEFHVTSGKIRPANYQLLPKLSDVGFAHAVSFHGFVTNDVDVYIGGSAPVRGRERIASRIMKQSPLDVQVARPGDGLYWKYGGMTPSNIVNRMSTDGGIQIEQTRRVRDKYAAVVCDAVQSEFEKLLIV